MKNLTCIPKKNLGSSDVFLTQAKFPVTWVNEYLQIVELFIYFSIVLADLANLLTKNKLKKKY